MTNEVILEVLKSIRQNISDLNGSVKEMRAEIHAVRGYMAAMQHDIQNLYGAVHSLEARVERIERGLNLVSEPG